jgi:hypothetical protein
MADAGQASHTRRSRREPRDGIACHRENHADGCRGAQVQRSDAPAIWLGSGYHLATSAARGRRFPGHAARSRVRGGSGHRHRCRTDPREPRWSRGADGEPPVAVTSSAALPHRLRGLRESSQNVEDQLIESPRHRAVPRARKARSRAPVVFEQGALLVALGQFARAHQRLSGTFPATPGLGAGRGCHGRHDRAGLGLVGVPRAGLPCL